MPTGQDGDVKPKQSTDNTEPKPNDNSKDKCKDKGK